MDKSVHKSELMIEKKIPKIYSGKSVHSCKLMIDKKNTKIYRGQKCTQ